jgi:hypothetical protein
MEGNAESARPNEAEKAFLLQTLLMDMGGKFRILIQQKGLPRVNLSGMRFSQRLV